MHCVPQIWVTFNIRSCFNSVESVLNRCLSVNVNVNRPTRALWPPAARGPQRLRRRLTANPLIGFCCRQGQRFATGHQMRIKKKKESVLRWRGESVNGVLLSQPPLFLITCGLADAVSRTSSSAPGGARRRRAAAPPAVLRVRRRLSGCC